jgi:hypothetical protein
MGMPAGPSGLSHVTRIDQRDDDTIDVHVETDSFSPGQAVEVSVYLIQGDTYAAFNDKKHIPYPDSNDANQPAELHVQLPAMTLDAQQQVTVVTRVSEVWPTILSPAINPNYVGKGPKASWTAEYPSGKAPGGS